MQGKSKEGREFLRKNGNFAGYTIPVLIPLEHFFRAVDLAHSSRSWFCALTWLRSRAILSERVRVNLA